MDQQEHYDKAEMFLARAGIRAERYGDEASSERMFALVKLAEAHMKMIPLAPMSMPSRPA